jgi:hypothetical protein
MGPGNRFSFFLSATTIHFSFVLLCSFLINFLSLPFLLALTIEHKETIIVLAAKLPISIAITTHTLKTMIIANRSSKPNQTMRDKKFGFVKVA